MKDPEYVTTIIYKDRYDPRKDSPPFIKHSESIGHLLLILRTEGWDLVHLFVDKRRVALNTAYYDSVIRWNVGDDTVWCKGETYYVLERDWKVVMSIIGEVFKDE